jgi:hypothetical protein
MAHRAKVPGTIFENNGSGYYWRVKLPNSTRRRTAILIPLHWGIRSLGRYGLGTRFDQACPPAQDILNLQNRLPVKT